MPEKEVLQRLKQMKDFGYKEVILCGINLGAWGKDLGSNFTSLIKKIDQEIPLFRIRLSSIEPMEITDELIDIIASSNMICPHLHLPLQSGDDEILKAMRRNYTSSEYFSLANRLLDKIKDLALGIDVIVGYPGESLAHFKRTQALLEKLEFMYLHVFPFSSRPGTLAQYIRSNLSAQEIKTRVHILRELSKEKKKRFISNYIGKSMEVLFDKVISYNQGIIRGITRNYIFVQVKAKREFIYKIGWVKILGIDSDLNAIGQLVSINNT
jgi:threonylcarbamoyladenosine tRNA methylthiotransferase MtaB